MSDDFYKEREALFLARLKQAGCGVADGGKYRADILSALSSLVADRDHWRDVAVYLADCHAASLDSLPKRAAKSRRQRMALICRKAAAMLEGAPVARPSKPAAVKRRIARVLVSEDIA